MNRRTLDRALAYADSWLEWRCPRVTIPGCAVAVWWRGTIAFAGAYGQADVEAGRRLRTDDVYRVASHSKTFTATAVLQLAERRRLQLDDPVADHLDWLRAHRDRRVRGITVRQLLSHGAGIVRDGLDADYWQLGRRFPDAGQLRDDVLEADLVTDPNVAMKYSNYGYGLLGMVIEAVSGATFADAVTEHICTPLGLASTAPEPRSDLAARAVTGYTRRQAGGARRPVPPVDTRALAPATGFASTVGDMCTFFSAQFVGSRRLLSDASKREMQRVQWHAHRPHPGVEQDYGLGLQLDTIGAHRAFGHSGGFPGQITRTFADPAERLVVTVLTSCSDGPAEEIGRGIFAILDRFANHAGEAPTRGLRRLEGRYVCPSHATDLVVPGGTPVAANPDSWEPFGDPDLLEPVDRATLRVADGGSYGGTGELVRFEMKDGAVASVNWTGTSMWPERHWAAVERRLLRRR